MEALLARSFRVYDGMPIVRTDKADDILYLQGVRMNFPDRSYAVERDMIAFIHDGVMYVTPKNKSTNSLLVAYQFKQRDFFVPFSDGSTPAVDISEWFALRKYAD